MIVRDPPFLPGQTFVNGAYTISSTDLPGLQYEGMEFEFNDEIWSASAGQPAAWRSYRRVMRRVVRNMNPATNSPGANGNMLPKFLYAEVAGQLGGRVAGLSNTYCQTRVWPADEWLPAAGCVPLDLCYVVTRGPALLMTPLDAGAANVINQGDQLVAQTGTTTGSTTGGRVLTVAPTAATTGVGSTLFNQARGVFAFAMTAVTTGNTNTAILADVVPQW